MAEERTRIVVIDEIRERWLEHRERQLADLYELELMLRDMKGHCRYFKRGHCLAFCRARKYCRPWEEGLKTLQE